MDPTTSNPPRQSATPAAALAGPGSPDDTTFPSPALVFGAFLVPAIIGYALANWLYHLGTGLGWKTSQFFFNYQELGFIKRGLVGSLLHPFPLLLHGEVFLILGVGMELTAIGVLVILFRRAARTLPPSSRGLLLAACSLSPAMFLHMGFDLGRFDALGLLAAIGSIYALQHDRWLLAGLASAVALLAHEATLVINFPLVLAFAWTRRETAAPTPSNWAWLVLPSIAVSAVIALYGGYEPGLGALARHFASDPRYLAATGGQVDQDAIAVITRSLTENVDYVSRMFWRAKAYIHLPVIILWGAAMTCYFRRFHRLNGIRQGLLYYAVFSPLLLSLIACDHYRWVALAATNMFLVLLLEIIRLAQAGTQAVIPRGGMAWLLLASAVLGPIGHAKSFPVFFAVAKYLATGESSN
jgi:hypothetical protein